MLVPIAQLLGMASGWIMESRRSFGLFIFIFYLHGPRFTDICRPKNEVKKSISLHSLGDHDNDAGWTSVSSVMLSKCRSTLSRQRSPFGPCMVALAKSECWSRVRSAVLYKKPAAPREVALLTWIVTSHLGLGFLVDIFFLDSSNIS